MRRNTAGLERDTREVLMRNQGHLRQRQFLCDYNRRARKNRSSLAIFLAQMTQHSMADITEIGRPFAQIAIRDGQHLSAELVDYAKQRTLSRESGLYGFMDSGDEFLVFQNQPMTIKDLEISLRHE